MNILPKKKWHVRTKENIARVRRDEAKAAEEEQRRLDRAITAENERRLEALRNQAAKKTSDWEPFTLRASAEASISTSTGHVNLFQDLEAAERNNFGKGNKEYEEEKRKEQQEFDSKLGIQKCFAEGTNELNKVQEWYAKVSRPWVKDDEKAKPSVLVAPPPATDAKLEDKKHHKRRRSKSSTSEDSDSDRKKRKKAKKEKKNKKKKKKKHRHNHSSEDEEKTDITELEIEKRNKLAALREERIRRERAERHRTQQLLDPKKTTTAPKQKYNSMFNPDLCRKQATRVQLTGVTECRHPFGLYGWSAMQKGLMSTARGYLVEKGANTFHKAVLFREDNINRGWKKLPGGSELTSDNSMLSERGRTQAKECAIRFSKVDIAHVFASPFDRTIETASIIVANKNLSVKPEPGLCEALYLCHNPPGFWDADKLKEKFPLVDTDYVPVYSKHTLPKEGFGDDACIARVRNTLDRITEKYDGNLLLVSHGAPIGAIHEIWGKDFTYVGQATVTKFVEVQKGKFRMEFSSDASHLSDKSNLRPW